MSQVKRNKKHRPLHGASTGEHTSCRNTVKSIEKCGVTSSSSDYSGWNLSDRWHWALMTYVFLKITIGMAIFKDYRIHKKEPVQDRVSRNETKTKRVTLSLRIKMLHRVAQCELFDCRKGYMMFEFEVQMESWHRATIPQSLPRFE